MTTLKITKGMEVWQVCCSLPPQPTPPQYFKLVVTDGMADSNSLDTYLIYTFMVLFRLCANARCLMRMCLEQLSLLRMTILVKDGLTCCLVHIWQRHSAQAGSGFKSLITAANLFSVACQVDLFFPDFITVLYAGIIHLGYFQRVQKSEW